MLIGPWFGRILWIGGTQCMGQGHRAAAAANGVGGAKLDIVYGFIENNGEVEAEADDDEGKCGQSQ